MLMVRLGGLTPPLSVEVTVKNMFFYAFPKKRWKKLKKLLPQEEPGLRWIRLVTTDSLDPTRQGGADPVMLSAEA